MPNLPDLKINVLTDPITILLKTAAKPLSIFTRSFSMEVGKSATIKLPDADGELQKNPTDYQDASAKGGSITITLDEYHHPYVVSPEDKRNGWRLTDLRKANLIHFINKIFAGSLAAIPTTNPKALGASDAFNGAKAKLLPKDIDGNGDTSLLLNPDYYLNLTPNDKIGFDLSEGAFNFDAIYKIKQSVFPDSIVGMAVNQDAIAMGTAIPEIDPRFKEDINQTVITVPELGGFAIMHTSWLDTRTRNEYEAFGIMAGWKVLNPDAYQVYQETVAEGASIEIPKVYTRENPPTSEDLDSMTVAKLKEIAAMLEMTGYETLLKAELLQAIKTELGY